jgi:hypothetical protein
MEKGRSINRKVIIFILIALAFFVGLLIGNLVVSGLITGNAVSVSQIDKNYSWTSAICQGNKCLDVLIECDNGSVKSLTPISDFVEFENGWKDTRDLDVEYCE